MLGCFQEQALPGLILASDPKTFQRLEQICCLGDIPVGGGGQMECVLRSKLIRGVRSVLLLIPTDPRVRSSLEGFSHHSPKGASDDTHTSLLPPDAILKDYLDASRISPYQLLYNMEVWGCGLSGGVVSPGCMWSLLGVWHVRGCGEVLFARF